MTAGRRLIAFAAAIAVVEGLAIVADHHWSFRARLLGAFDVATRARKDSQETWSDPGSLFSPSHGDFSRPLRLRVIGSPNPIGEVVDAADLPPGERVVVLGESAAFGVGCRSEDTFTAILDQSLRTRGTHVLNAGQVGADMWQVMEAGAQILHRYSPSTLILFTGNNVWIDWRPPQQQRTNPVGIEVLSTLAHSRAVAGLEFVLLRWILLHTPRKWRVERLAELEAAFHRDEAPPGLGGAAVFLDHHEIAGSEYALDHPLAATEEFGPADWAAVKGSHLARFERSLETLLENAGARGVRVVLATIPFNLRLSPAWKHPQFETYSVRHASEVRGLLHEGGRLRRTGDCAGALVRIGRALALDPGPPLLHYLRGQCLEHLGRRDEAADAYAQSRERMIGNLGSPLSVNAIIRSLAARFEVPLVDVARVFDEHWRRNQGAKTGFCPKPASIGSATSRRTGD